MSRADRDSLVRADDAEMIERSRRDPEYFAVLFDRHAPSIHRYVARRAGREVADDLVAETARALDIPIGTVRSRLNRARDQAARRASRRRPDDRSQGDSAQ
jgi:DNA-directed RNA polymerase specialized sigma24 family protein